MLLLKMYISWYNRCTSIIKLFIKFYTQTKVFLHKTKANIMAIKYNVTTKRSGVGEKVVKHYANPVRSGEIGTRQLAEELSERCTLTETDIRATLIGLSKMIEEYLHKGYSVRLDDLGRFTLSATSDGFDLPEDCTSSKVKAKKICFMADKRLKEKLNEVTFVRKK